MFYISRWFVLDSTKHQIRYYDTREDFQCRGHIDLKNVTGCKQLKANSTNVNTSGTPGAPKKSEEACYFELHTQKRNFCFCADSPEDAKKWTEKIQMSIQ